MSAGMAEVIAAHNGYQVKMPNDANAPFNLACLGCGNERPIINEVGNYRTSPQHHAAHVAEELAKAGYGDVREAKEDAFAEAVAVLRDRGKWTRSEHGPYVVKTGYDEDGHGNAAQDVDEWYAGWLEQFPYRESVAGDETPEQYADRVDRLTSDPARIKERKDLPPAFAVPRRREAGA